MRSLVESYYSGDAEEPIPLRVDCENDTVFANRCSVYVATNFYSLPMSLRLAIAAGQITAAEACTLARLPCEDHSLNLSTFLRRKEEALAESYTKIGCLVITTYNRITTTSTLNILDGIHTEQSRYQPAEIEGA